jgi:hypothetical protein
MTASEIISQLQSLRAEVNIKQLATAQAGQNPSWLLIARGALDKAIEQIELHQKNNETAVPRTAAAPAAPTGPAPGLPLPHMPAQVDAETAALRAH